jgi:glycosyltransferase involved in cell wall biosynthesis
MEKLISIILPTFNGSQYIKSAIESILAQSYKNWELIIIDDGSTDMTEAIVFNYVNANSNIKYFKNEKNIGIQKSLNKGLHLAKGEYIARIDDDDEWIDKEKLKKQLDFFKDNREYVLLGTGVIMSNYNGNLIKYLLPEKDKEIRLRILSKNCFAHPTVMYKKEM